MVALFLLKYDFVSLLFFFFNFYGFYRLLLKRGVLFFSLKRHAFHFNFFLNRKKLAFFILAKTKIEQFVTTICFSLLY